MTYPEQLLFYDLHCHLDFAENMQELAGDLGKRGIGCLSTTVTPEGYKRSRSLLKPFDNVRLALGLHPWWVSDNRSGEKVCNSFESLVDTTSFIGEVGLDFGSKHGVTRDAQRMAFERVVVACAAAGNKVVSMHAVRATTEALDLLERHRCLENNACIFHWFSGSFEELQRAIKCGCYFSVGERMLATKRGQAYVGAIPQNRLLLETDMPAAPIEVISSQTMEASLTHALELLEKVRGEDLAAQLVSTSEALLFLR